MQNNPEIWPRSWEMTCKEDVSFKGLAQIDPFFYAWILNFFEFHIKLASKHTSTVDFYQLVQLLPLWPKGSIGIRNSGGKSWFWTPFWLFLTTWTCGFLVFYVKEASCLISSSSATFTLSAFFSSMTSLISSSTCPILTFYTFLESPDQMLAIDEEKRGWGKE